MSFEATDIRAAFPILLRRVNGRPLVYFDTAASAQKPEPVIEAMSAAMRHSYANVHRGLHTLANETTTAFENARAAAARLINAPGPEQIVFTKGATEAINLVASGLGASVRPGDEIVLSVMEHHANIVPWHFLRERRGAILRWVDVDDAGRLDMSALASAIGPRTRMVALTAMSNVFGAETPVADIVALAHAQGAPVLLDGCQHIVHGMVDVCALGVDYYVFSSHKLYGPTGLGVLYGRAERLAALPPYQGGGEMIDIVEQDRISYADPPHRFEAGTPPILEAIGFGAALAWLSGIDRVAAERHERALGGYARERLAAMNGVTVFGGLEDRPILAFNLDGAHPHDVAQILDRQGVAVRAGHHCAQPLMRRLGVTATARASFGVYNTREEVDIFIDALAKARKLLS
ncbi:MAG: cysteine desulfurase [Alphaproteobacteria bacterium]|jgi:cysteine desulfurase/selenocysteine lyase|nr:cysteine desulfurase [Alphaproteobacteria bacterium]